MKTVFDKPTLDELIKRVNSLDESSKAQWGKMNIYQMLKHCILAEEYYLGKVKYNRAFIGLLFGKMALKKMLKDDSPLAKNTPTSPHFIPADSSGDIGAEKKKWISLLEEYADYKGEGIVHFFFGKINREQLGQFVYKHADHHLRQFNV